VPLFDFRIYTKEGIPTEDVFEKFFKSNVDVPKKLIGEDGTYALRIPSLPAKTPGLWHGGWSNGLDGGQWSSALGRKVANTHEEAKAMKAKGFIAESDLGHGWIESTQNKLASKCEAQANYANKYQENLKTMKPEDAVAATWSAEDCLSGRVDDIYNTEEAIVR
jgi:hypothetical protein